MPTIALLLMGFVGLFFGGLAGYVEAHTKVSQECKKLGAFYVGDTVYECKPKVKGE